MFKPFRQQIVFASAAITCALLLSTMTLLAERPEGKGGGKGGGGGDESLTNPALVYLDVQERALFLLSSDGLASSRTTKPKGRAGDNHGAWSPDGTKIAFLRQPDYRYVWNDLYTVNPDGSGLTLERSFGPGEPRPATNWRIAWSPDGSRIAFRDDSAGGLWALDLDTGVLELLTAQNNFAHDPTFSPDLDTDTAGYQGLLAYVDTDPVVGLQYDILLLEVEIDSNGALWTGARWNLTETADIHERAPAWSPDGEFLVFSEDSEAFTGLVVSDLLGGPAIPILATRHPETYPTWSPDGRFLAFQDIREAGGGVTWDLFRVRPDGSDMVPLTNSDGLSHREVRPHWNPIWTNDIDR